MNKLSKQTDLKHSFILLYFGYMWRTLPPFYLQTVFGDFIFLSEQLVYSVMEKRKTWYKHNLCEFLHFFSKTTLRPFKLPVSASLMHNNARLKLNVLQYVTQKLIKIFETLLKNLQLQCFSVFLTQVMTLRGKRFLHGTRVEVAPTKSDRLLSKSF